MLIVDRSDLEAFCPKTCGMSDDTRMLGAVIHRIAVVPASSP